MIEIAYLGIFYMRNYIVTWHSKKYNCVSLSTVEEKYIDVGSCYTQLLWMKKCWVITILCGPPTILCDNTCVIDISKNIVQNSRTKHIDIRHHLIRDLIEARIICIEYVSTENQLANLFTKPLDMNVVRFENLMRSIGVCNID